MAQPKLANLTLWGEANTYNEGRAYRHPETGERYPSVTTVLRLVDKSGLSQWAADQAILWAIDNVEVLLQRSPEAAFAGGRYRWTDFRDERAQVGTGVHETVEAQHTGSWEFPVLDDEQVLIMEQWATFCSEHVVEPILSEFSVFDTKKGYAGTADGYWLIDGKLTLVDLKTSRNTWPEHMLQLAALWAAPEWVLETGPMQWTSEPARPIEAVAIIHLRADKHELIWVQDLPENSKIFDSYTSVWYAKEALKAAEKARKQEILADGFSNVTPIGVK